jgi:hypothetical protein
MNMKTTAQSINKNILRKRLFVACMNLYTLLLYSSADEIEFSIFYNYFKSLCMKRNFLFLMSVLVLGMMMTSCMMDEESVTLTSIRVDPESIELPVGESQKVTVTAVPDNAIEVSYEWTSSNENVATVSQDGTVTIAGLGTATVTVKSGTITQDIPVTVTLKSLTVKDENDASAGTYPFTEGLDDPVTFTLTATLDPAGSVKPEWSVDVSTVTVAASSDGLSAIVSIKGEGTAVVSVTAGGLTATYTITTSSPMKTVKGYWTFDDPNNLYKATVGQDLLPGGWDDAVKPIAAADGPSESNGAINVPMYNFLKCVHGIAANGPEGAKRVNEYTVMFDVMELNASVYHPLLQCNVDNALNQTNESAFYLKSRGRIGTGEVGNSPNGTTKNGIWYRVIISAKAAVEGGFCNYYLNGELLKENPFAKNRIDHTRFTLNPAGVLFFADTRPGNPYNETGDGYDFKDDGLHVAAVAIWDHPLTAEEIAALGGVE